jgi:hypothetical protein
MKTFILGAFLLGVLLIVLIIGYWLSTIHWSLVVGFAGVVLVAGSIKLASDLDD